MESAASEGVVQDAIGVWHPIAEPGARIVSLVPSITELVCDFGLTENLVGRTGFCVHPREIVRRIPKVGGTKSVNIDRLRELAPSHVIVNIDENTREAVDQIARFVPHVVVTHPLAPLDNLALYRLLGTLFRREKETEELCRRFRGGYDRLLARARHWPRERVLYLIWKRPWMTVSRDTYVSRTLSLINWDTVPAVTVTRYPEVALGELIEDADRVLLSSEPYRFRERDVAELKESLGGKIRVERVDGEMTSWYGSRAIAAMDYLARLRGG
jgi:ABC-type Fe3+-hydroxamate transport system substrate-binding protein